MRRGLWVGIGIIGILFFIVLLGFGSYISAKNQMVVKDEAVNTQWSQVDVVLQRRADLIPNLVETVKGFAKHEETVFGDIANARAGLLNARDPQSKMAANNQLDGALGRLLVLTENYPDLKSNANFRALQDELAGTENRIAVERRRYNDSVNDYDVFIRQFPNSFWAGIAGFKESHPRFEATEASRTAPAVKF